MITDLPFFGMLGEKIKWLGQRQRVITQNISNSDTPDYKAKDLKPLNFETTLRGETSRLELARTSDRHVESPLKADAYRVLEERSPQETSPNGNSVLLEEQMMHMNTINSQHDLSIKLTRKYLQMYKIALGKNSQG